MPVLSGVFPRSFPLLSHHTPPDSSPNFEWGAAGSMAGFIALVTASQNECAADLDALDRLSLALYEDLQDQREVLAGRSEVRALDFLQFWISVSPLGAAAQRRRFSMARDWGTRALVDGYSSETEEEVIQTQRIPSFRFLTDTTLRDQVPMTLLEWAEHFFYVSWATNDQLHLARAVLAPLQRLAVGVLTNGSDDPDLVDDALGAVLSITRWLDRYDEPRAAPLAAALAAFEENDDIFEAPRKRAALLLSGPPGRHTDTTPAERARRSLDRYGHLLAGHERVALLASALAGDADGALRQLDAVLEAVDEYTSFMTDRPAVDRLYERGRLFGQIGGLVRTLAVAGHATAALSLLGRWHGVQEVRRDVLLLLAADPDGARWISEGRVEPEPADASTLGPLTAVANRALGLSISYVDAHEEGLPEPLARPGVPDPGAASEYEELCEQHLRLEGLVRQDDAGGTRAIVMVPGLPVPVCAMARRHVDRPYPLSVSLSSPYPDRPVRRVAIWPSDLVGSAEETDAVCGLFEASGVEVEIIGGDLTTARFKDVYARDDLDVLWIGCHGERLAFRPEHSFLRLSQGHELALEAMLDLPAPRAADRRLLVLNACDSGTAAQFGGLAEFGIGSILAGPAQAVVGHQWPVGLLEAAGFGALLAAGLADGCTYPDAFGRAADVLRGGLVTVAEALHRRHVPGELLRRLDAARDRRFNVLNWGSVVLLE